MLGEKGCWKIIESKKKWGIKISSWRQHTFRKIRCQWPNPSWCPRSWKNLDFTSKCQQHVFSLLLFMRDYLSISQISDSEQTSTRKLFPVRIISSFLTTLSNSWFRMRNASVSALHRPRKQHHKMDGKQWLWAASSLVPPSTRNTYVDLKHTFITTID